jgi:sugar/nucleoside kinase (ribokinase family)
MTINSETTKHQIENYPPLDYLLVGHFTKDLVNASDRLGGTPAYSGLTATALGLRTGVITSFSDDLDTSSVETLWIKNKTSNETTTYKNISDGKKRTQYLYHIAEPLTCNDLMEFHQQPKILHLGPMADEVDPNILSLFPNSLKCLTPQGWFRMKNPDFRVEFKMWENAEIHLSNADAAVISMDDVQKNEDYIAKLAASIPVFVVTENYKGARIYWHNDVRYISAPEVEYVDDTGAGDIFSAAFFYRYFFTRDPWEAGRFAVLLASWSVGRKYLDSIPTKDEIERAKLFLVGQ